MKRVRVILSPEAEEVYKYLVKEASTSKNERAILNGIKKKIQLIKWDFDFIDVQQDTAHMKSLGAKNIDRRKFIHLLNTSLTKKSIVGNWNEAVNT